MVKNLPGDPEPVFTGDPESVPISATVDLAARVAETLGLRNPVTVEFLRVCFDNAKLFDKKQTDYGPTNISKHGTYGVMVRMSDKHERLATLMNKRRRRPQNESVLDTLRDIANYAVIATMLETNKWL